MPVEPPRGKGPPLNALRAFESAARLGSFKAAAEELAVTPGAIAQHIKALETWCRAPLFKRHHRSISLTELGENLLPRFTDAFDRLNEAVHALRTGAEPGKIRIAALPAIAQLWLPRRLALLREIDSEAHISVTAMENPPNLARDDFDLSLFLEGRGDGTALKPDVIFPVCTPSIANRLREIPDLARETLLRDSSWDSDWKTWLGTVSGGSGVPVAGPVYSLFSIALEEARRGRGILMAHEILVGDLLQSGELVVPFPHLVETGLFLTLRCSPILADSPLGVTVRSTMVQPAP